MKNDRPFRETDKTPAQEWAISFIYRRILRFLTMPRNLCETAAIRRETLFGFAGFRGVLSRFRGFAQNRERAFPSATCAQHPRGCVSFAATADEGVSGVSRESSFGNHTAIPPFPGVVTRKAPRFPIFPALLSRNRRAMLAFVGGLSAPSFGLLIGRSRSIPAVVPSRVVFPSGQLARETPHAFANLARCCEISAFPAAVAGKTTPFPVFPVLLARSRTAIATFWPQLFTFLLPF